MTTRRVLSSVVIGAAAALAAVLVAPASSARGTRPEPAAAPAAAEPSLFAGIQQTGSRSDRPTRP